MKIVKRIVFILFVILLVAVISVSIVKVAEASEPDPNASGLELLDGVFEAFLWSSFCWCVYEILYNIAFFWVYKKERAPLLSRLSVISLVLSFVRIFVLGSMLIILYPIVYIAYFIVKIIYLIAFIKNAVDLKREQMDC